MCCTEPIGFDVPDEVASMLLSYQDLREGDPDGLWGDRAALWVRTLVYRCPFLAEPRRRELWRQVRHDPDWTDSQEFPTWVRDVVREDGKPDELTVVHLNDAGVEVDAAVLPWVLPGGEPTRRHVLVDSHLAEPVVVDVDGRELSLPALGAALVVVDVGADRAAVTVAFRDLTCAVPLAEVAVPAHLRLRAGACVRWSVVDARGGAWFPDGVHRKWDFHGRPFFHGDDVVVEVPPGPLRVRVTRGLEYHGAELSVTSAPGEERLVELAPTRWIDPAARGWYGADLHVHMNYGSEHVVGPRDAALMQYGEGLHYMNLVAANESSSLIYDRQALEAWPGQDLPWSEQELRARMGVEYRNDLLGHFHATGLTAPPSSYHTGHAGSDAEEDWPPNATALEEFRGLDAVTAYCHPVQDPLEDTSPPDDVFARVRSVECRELVADAALGLVDGMDVVSNLNDQGAAVVFRRLLGAGIPIAATVGTDSMLSVRRDSTYANPPGWARMYAQVDGPLTVDGLKDAVRAGRTIATNGPWVELTVEEQGPGARVDVSRGAEVRIHAAVHGPGVQRLRIYTADGPLAETDVPNAEGATLDVALPVDEPTFVVAVADGGSDPEVLTDQTMAHTSAVYVDVEGRRVARAEHARWCLDWLTQLEKLAAEHGVFHEPAHRDDLAQVIGRARTYYEKVAAGSASSR